MAAPTVIKASAGLKITDLRNVTNDKIKQVELSINYKTFRKFNYLSPIETLNNKFVALMS